MRSAKAGVGILLAGGLGACASLGDGPPPPNGFFGRNDAPETQSNASQANASGRDTAERDAARATIGREDMLSQMAYWAGDYGANPEDPVAARGFAEALRQGGRHDRAIQVSLEALRRQGEDPALWRTLGLSYLASGQPQQALQPLALWARSDTQDAGSRSALGIALDQLERFDEARAAYQEALAITPDDPRILTNLGVSFLLTGEAADAEAVLRQAAALPGAPPEARQNLVIALGLQGRLEEAEAIARVDLPPTLAAANLAYLRGLFEDPRRWGELDGLRQ